MRKKQIKKNQYIGIAVAGVFLLALILFLSTSNILGNSNVPMGYKKNSLFSRELAPLKEPKIIEAAINDQGFSQKTISVPFQQDGTFYELQLANTSDTVKTVRMVRTPNGEWKEDPVTKIPAGEKIPYVFLQIGEYTIENAQNTQQSIIIQVK
jgi:hypothetical protein